MVVPTRGRSHLLLVPSGRARAWVLGVAAPPPFRVSGFGSRVSVRTAHLELERRGHIIYHPKPVCLSSAPSPSPTSQTALLAKPRILVNYIFPLLWLCGGRLANRRALVALVSRSRSHKKNTRAAAASLVSGLASLVSRLASSRAFSLSLLSRLPPLLLLLLQRAAHCFFPRYFRLLLSPRLFRLLCCILPATRRRPSC